VGKRIRLSAEAASDGRLDDPNLVEREPRDESQGFVGVVGDLLGSPHDEALFWSPVSNGRYGLSEGVGDPFEFEGALCHEVGLRKGCLWVPEGLFYSLVNVVFEANMFVDFLFAFSNISYRVLLLEERLELGDLNVDQFKGAIGRRFVFCSDSDDALSKVTDLIDREGGLIS
jgi:hypothetical protein